MCLGIPGQIIEISDAKQSMAKVDVAGIQREVNIACIIDENLPIEKLIGEWVLVHVGFAMSHIDAEEARKTLQLLTELSELEDELQAMTDSTGQ